MHGRERSTARFQRAAAAAGWVAMLIGTVVLFGTWAGAPRLTYLRAEWPAMGANTALMNILAGAALLALSRPGGHLRKRLGTVAALLVTLIAAITLSEWLLGWNAGIDRLLAPAHGVRRFRGGRHPIPRWPSFRRARSGAARPRTFARSTPERAALPDGHGGADARASRLLLRGLTPVRAAGAVSAHGDGGAYGDGAARSRGRHLRCASSQRLDGRADEHARGRRGCAAHAARHPGAAAHGVARRLRSARELVPGGRRHGARRVRLVAGRAALAARDEQSSRTQGRRVARCAGPSIALAALLRERAFRRRNWRS